MSEIGWQNTYPMVMRKNGYYTGWVGKNHVPVGEGGYSSGVMEKSFDYWYAGHGHLRFYPKEIHEIFKHANADTQVEIVSEGIQDFLSNDQKLEGAVKFLDQRPADKPFILSVNFNLPHGAGTSSMQLRETDDAIYRTLYRDKDIPLPKNYIAKDDIKKPRLPADLLHAEDRQNGYDWVNTPEGYRERIIRQMEAMTGIDRLVGQLLETLKEQKLDKNTILVFTSDHGLFSGQFGLGGKAFCYEIATHVPMIILDPRAKKSFRGKISDALVQSIDIAPTMLTMAGIAIPDSYQGKDLTGLMAGKVSAVRTVLYTENLWSTQFGNPRCEAVQDKKWKYIRYYKNQNFSALKKIATAKAMGIDMSNMLYKVHDPDIAVYRDYIENPLQGEPAVYEELFNLQEDPNETTNLATNEIHADQLVKMRIIWEREINNSRGENAPQVLRYTSDSEAERGMVIAPK